MINNAWNGLPTVYKADETVIEDEDRDLDCEFLADYISTELSTYDPHVWTYLHSASYLDHKCIIS